MLHFENDGIRYSEQDKKAWQIVSRIVESISAGAEVKIVTADQRHALFEIVKTDPGIIIGKHGHTLDAIQYIVNLIMNRRRGSENYKNYIVDVDGYRKRREESLKRYAREQAELAKRKGYNISLYYMNSMERRLVHMALQEDTDIVTSSEGREPYRRIIIKPSSVKNEEEDRLD